jgi:hypothetical protein
MMSGSSTSYSNDGEAWKASDREHYRGKAAAQLGAVGSGNHYVDLMRDEQGFVWVGVQFGEPRPGPFERDQVSQGRGRQGWHESRRP